MHTVAAIDRRVGGVFDAGCFVGLLAAAAQVVPFQLEPGRVLGDQRLLELLLAVDYVLQVLLKCRRARRTLLDRF